MTEGGSITRAAGLPVQVAGEAAGPQAGVRGMVLLRGKEEVEDEGDEELIPSHGEEAMHHTDGHDLLLKLLPVCFW